VRRCTIPRLSRAPICCMVNCRKISVLGVVEKVLGSVVFANNLDEHGELLIQCVNPFTESVELSVGSLLG